MRIQLKPHPPSHVFPYRLHRFSEDQWDPQSFPTQEFLILFNNSRFAFQNLLTDRNCGRKPGSILIHIKRRIEMGNPCPLQCNFRVADHIRSKILLIQFIINVAVSLCRNTSFLFHQLMSLLFKLSKHRLPVNSSLKLIQKIIDQIHFLFSDPWHVQSDNGLTVPHYR